MLYTLQASDAFKTLRRMQGEEEKARAAFDGRVRAGELQVYSVKYKASSRLL